MKLKRIAVLLATASLFTTGIPVQASGFSLSQTSAVVNTGEQVDLDIEGSAKIAAFTSADDNIASVNSDGVVTGVRSGQTTVSARIGQTSKTCKVSVIAPSVKLDKESAVLYTGQTLKTKATVKGTEKTASWESANENVASVDKNGTITAVAPGSTIVKAAANGKAASMRVTVTDARTRLNVKSVTLSTRKPGNTVTLKAAVNGPKAAVAWTSSNPAVASVKSGKVTAKAEGTAVITATANGIADTCSVTVKQGSINITQDEANLYLGGTEVKTLKLTTNAAKKETVEWRSHDSNIVTVDAKGVLTAVKTGQTTVEAVSSDGTNDICVVTVSDTATEILENEAVLKTKGYDKTHTLTTTVNGKSQKITWKSGNTKVVTVKNGKLTAKKAGETTVTATANGVSDTVKVIVNDFEPTTELSQKSATLYTGKNSTLTLKAIVDGNSTATTWSSSDTSVATVSAKGKITAKAEGTAIITATANGVSDTCSVTVREPKVILPETLHMGKGDVTEIPVDVIGKSQKITWKSGNTKAVTVKNGTLTAKAYGEADIKATANGVTAVCHVTVSECTHSFDAGVVTKEPSCGTEGVKTFTCKLCKATYTESIPMTDNHQWSDWHVITEPTEEKEGVKQRTCSVCKKVESETLPKSSHTHNYKVTGTVNPTCTEQGYSVYTCACGDTYQADYKDAFGHTWSNWKINRKPTETVAGQMSHTCVRCRTTETQEIPATGHTHKYTVVVTEATCTQKGFTTYTCSCGDTYTDAYVNALGHAWGEWATTKEPTTTEMGVSTRKCIRCGEAEAKDIPMLEDEKPHEHAWKAVFVQKATCTTGGFTKYECECGETQIGEYTKELGHDYEEVITKEPTCTEEGVKTFTCRREGCTSVVTREIPKIAHEWEQVIDEEPTCEATGTYSNRCRNCGLRTSSGKGTIPALGHDEELVKTVETASKDNGPAADYYTCKRCGRNDLRNVKHWVPDPEEIYKDMINRVKSGYVGPGTPWSRGEGGRYYTNQSIKRINEYYKNPDRTTACAGLVAQMQYELFGPYCHLDNVISGNDAPVSGINTYLISYLNKLRLPSYGKDQEHPEKLQVGDAVYFPELSPVSPEGHVAAVVKVDLEKEMVTTVEYNDSYIYWYDMYTFDTIRKYCTEIVSYFPPNLWPEDEPAESNAEASGIQPFDTRTEDVVTVPETSEETSGEISDGTVDILEESEEITGEEAGKVPAEAVTSDDTATEKPMDMRGNSGENIKTITGP